MIGDFMHLVIAATLIMILIYGPYFWAMRVLNRYNTEQYFSGTGLDLARLLLERMDMAGANVEETDLGDHFDPQANVVRLNTERCSRRSLTAIVVAAHEVGAFFDDGIHEEMQVRCVHIRVAQDAVFGNRGKGCRQAGFAGAALTTQYDELLHGFHFLIFMMFVPAL